MSSEDKEEKSQEITYHDDYGNKRTYKGNRVEDVSELKNLVFSGIFYVIDEKRFAVKIGDVIVRVPTEVIKMGDRHMGVEQIIGRLFIQGYQADASLLVKASRDYLMNTSWEKVRKDKW